MKKILLLSILLFPLSNFGQVVIGNGFVQYTASAPSGSCGQNAPMQIIIGSGALYTCQNGTWAQVSGGGGGGVSSVALTAPSSLFSVTGSPITSSGTLALTFKSITGHLYLGNNTGSSATAALVQPACGDLSDATLCNTSTVGPGNGGTGVQNPTVHATPVAEGSSNFNFVTVPGSPANCIYQYIKTVSAGADVEPTWTCPGVLPNPETGTSYTIATGDRLGYISFSNASAIAVTLPQAGSTGFGSNFSFVTCDIGAGTATITPTTSTISYSTGYSYTSAASSLALTTGQCAWVYSNNTNYFAIVLTAGAVTSVSNSDGTLTISPTTGAVVASIALGHANTWTATQTFPAGSLTGTEMANATVTATQLAAQYSKGACVEVWGGTGASNALSSGDDAISNNTCYNDSGVTRTITAVKCRSDNGSNTTTVNPTFGSAGTGTTILSGALTCGNSYAYSSSGTVSNGSWTTGSGIDPAMGGTLTGTSIAMIVEYTY